MEKISEIVLENIRIDDFLETIKRYTIENPYRM
jgi:hypothetical protein